MIFTWLRNRRRRTVEHVKLMGELMEHQVLAGARMPAVIEDFSPGENDRSAVVGLAEPRPFTDETGFVILSTVSFGIDEDCLDAVEVVVLHAQNQQTGV